MKTYEIGGIHVEMTEGAAARWNAGCPTEHDLRTSRAFLPEPQNQYREISLRRATNRKLEPETASQIDSISANEVTR